MPKFFNDFLEGNFINSFLKVILKQYQRNCQPPYFMASHDPHIGNEYDEKKNINQTIDPD